MDDVPAHDGEGIVQLVVHYASHFKQPQALSPITTPNVPVRYLALCPMHLYKILDRDR